MTAPVTAAVCLSMSGRFAPFGRQAAGGLRIWADHAGIDLTIVDDESSPDILEERLTELMDADLLFGPYSTVLARRAAKVATARGLLLFNHGGSGGTLNIPGHVVNVLTPANRYALPFFRFLCAEGGGTLYTATGPGAFGRDVIAGAQYAGFVTENLDFHRPPTRSDGVWDLLSAGVYEDDVYTVLHARALPNPPRYVCSVAAGVASFATDVGDPDGVFGIGQWAPGAVSDVATGMDEREFLNAWRDRFGTVPDYPGVQAYAAGVIASTALAAAGSSAAAALWPATVALNVETMFGRFLLDPSTGEQVGHDSVLTCWHNGAQQSVQ